MISTTIGVFGQIFNPSKIRTYSNTWKEKVKTNQGRVGHSRNRVNRECMGWENRVGGVNTPDYNLPHSTSQNEVSGDIRFNLAKPDNKKIKLRIKDGKKADKTNSFHLLKL